MTVSLPDTPAARQLEWLLGRIVDPGGLTEAEVEAHLVPAFLDRVPADRLIAMMGDLHAGLAEHTVEAVHDSGPSSVVARVRAAAGGAFRVECLVEQAEPHRLAMARVDPMGAGAGARPVAWADVLARESEPARSSDLAPDLTADVDEQVATFRQELKLPGLAVAIVDRDHGIRYWRGLGTAHLDPWRPPTPQTVVRVGSITKTMTAIGIMQLVEAGKVDLDAPANDYLTSYQLSCAESGAEPITVRHLLTHTSGILPGANDIGADEGAPVPTLAEFFGPTLVAARPPGQAWAYSNDAFATAGQLIADVSGTPFPAYMAGHVFDPLGMTHTSYLPDDRASGDLYTGYVTEFDEVAPVAYRDIIVQGAGSVFSTTDDMARYVGALLNGGANATGRVLEARSLEEMWRVQKGPSPEGPMEMGLAFVLADHQGHPIVWHNGGWPGANSEMWLAPDDGWAVLAFTNTFTATGGSRLDQFAKTLLERIVSG